MLVQIKSTSEDSDVEWALIELNGELIIPTESIDDKNELELGAIRFTSDVSSWSILMCSIHFISNFL